MSLSDSWARMFWVTKMSFTTRSARQKILRLMRERLTSVFSNLCGFLPGCYLWYFRCPFCYFLYFHFITLLISLLRFCYLHFVTSISVFPFHHFRFVISVLLLSLSISGQYYGACFFFKFIFVCTLLYSKMHEIHTFICSVFCIFPVWYYCCLCGQFYATKGP